MPGVEIDWGVCRPEAQHCVANAALMAPEGSPGAGHSTDVVRASQGPCGSLPHGLGL